jgi:phosphatidylinositol alpha-mannosyltransferase
VKIGLVTPMFHPYPGGVSEHVHNLHRGLKRRGHVVKVVTTSFGHGASSIEEDVIRIGRAVHVLANGSVCPVAVSPAMSRRARAVLEAERFDVLHVHEPLMPMLCLAFVAGADVPVVGTFHASNDSPHGYRVFRSALAPFAARLSRRIAVSETAKRSVERFFDGEYRVIPNGVDVARFAAAEPLPAADGGVFRILFVGRMEPRKGAKYLFRALPDLARRVPSFRLTVVGGGPLSWYYRLFVPPAFRPRVVFEGRVSAEALARHYASADVFCSPATGGESFGIVLLEAMAAGAAIVASDIPGYRGVVADEDTGLLVRPKSSPDIADAIARLFHDRTLASSLVARAREEVQRYSWDHVTDEILGVYEEALSGEAADRVPQGARAGGGDT